MKKKAGIIVGASVAGLLALSPLAFADDSNGGINGGNGNNITTPLQGCNNDVNAVGGQVEGLSLAGLGSSAGGQDACAQPTQTADGS